MSNKSRLTWRVNEIVIVSVVAVACAVVFWVWDIGVSPAAKTIFAAVPEYQPLIGGAWLLAGVLGAQHGLGDRRRDGGEDAAAHGDQDRGEGQPC